MEERIVELETRLAFQENTIEELSDVVAQQQIQLDDVIKELLALKEQYQNTNAEGAEGQGEEPPPPHY